MTTPAWNAPSEQPGRRPTWLVLTASERGASHIAMGAPNQDSFGYERAGAQGMVAAVADGHGHSRHLRSARGSRLAAQIGCQVAQELADQIEGGLLADVSADGIGDLAKQFLVPEVVRRWREGVLADVEADPFSEAEDAFRMQGDDPTIAYGSTLLLGMTLGDWLLLAQIGDGDVVAVRADGRALLPVPSDPQLDGLVTTSLCGPDARSDFRIGMVDTAQTPLLTVLLATDGYANAQVVDDWPAAFSADLAKMLAEHDVHWLAGQLPGWAAHCASAHGSADDTTIAMLVSPAVAGTTPRPADGEEKGPEETTIPAAPHSETVRNDTVPNDTVPNNTVPNDTVPNNTVPNNTVPGSTGADGSGSGGEGMAGPHPTEPITVRLTAVPADGQADDSAADGADEHGGEAAIAPGERPTTEWEPPGGESGAR